MVKHLLLGLLLTCWQCEYCLAEEVLSDSNEEAAATEVVDYEKHVREIAQKTAEDAKARKAQERLDRAKTSSLNLVSSTRTVNTTNPTTTTNKTVSSAQITLPFKHRY